jgi:hypothetical protein
MMDDERTLPGMPVLDRQAAPARRDASGRPLVPSRVPEERPTPLQEAFIPVSVVALVCGVVAISALELGTPLASPLVRGPMLVSGLLLAIVGADAFVRVWRSAFAWLRVDRGRGLFRFVWVAAIALGVAGSLAAAVIAIRGGL